MTYGVEEKFIVDRINTPIKELAVSFTENTLKLTDALKLLKMVMAMRALPIPTMRDTKDANIRILIDLREEVLSRLIPTQYKKVVGAVFNYAIYKLKYDGFYRQLFNWVFKELLKRGWQFPDYNVPSLKIWRVMPKETGERMSKTIRGHFKLRADKYHNASLTEKEKILDEFVDVLIKELGVEVDSWR